MIDEFVSLFNSRGVLFEKFSIKGEGDTEEVEYLKLPKSVKS
jgi:hypothetical protein